MELMLVLGLFIPFLSFLILLICPLPRKAVEIIGCGTILLSFIAFAFAQTSTTLSLFTWIPVAGINADFALHLDHLSHLMTLIITGIGFLIHVYSIGYMSHDKDISRYFAIMNFFIFSMLLLVLAEHLLVLFIGWEGVGLASYLLIGYWYQKPEAACAATKAFVVNRIGDLGLLLGILFIFSLLGTGNIQEISQRASELGATNCAIITLLFFWGASGKSAQLPLHVWLPDAMEGPTPVSALIHAATMVTAGVYLIVRMHFVVSLAPQVLEYIGYIGGATALFAALCALSQTDLKRVLAYSTISQLGLMFLAIGVQAYYAAMFHLTTHAFIKALLFLSAGNVIHMLHGETEMKKMGGLAKFFPKTHACFLIGVLAMSGLPPFAAFFSKDLILEEELAAGYWTLYYTGLAVSILTAFYLTRAYLLTFQGKAPQGIQKQEAPSVMLTPVAILALLAVVGGFLGFALHQTPILMEYLEADSETLASHVGIHLCPETLIPIGAALLGISIALALYRNLSKTIPLFQNSFYIDSLYRNGVVMPLKSIARALNGQVEPALFDTTITMTSNSSLSVAGILQKIQSGQIRSYIAWIILGASAILAFVIVKGA